MVAIAEKTRCEGCEKFLPDMDIALGYYVCFPCTKARHKAVLRKKCVCKKAEKRESHIKRVGSRTWISCLRCLGQIKQLS